MVPSFSTTPVVPRCECAPLTKPAGVDFARAVDDAYEAFVKECAGEDTRQTLLRMQHFASSAGMALLEGNTKLYVSCLVSNAALSRLLTSRATPLTETTNADSSVDGATSRDQ